MTASGQSTIEPGTSWRNLHTRRIDVVANVGPCEQLEGRTRVWLRSELLTRSNGWDPDDFIRCWERQ
jgi:hypothetical protein